MTNSTHHSSSTPERCARFVELHNDGIFIMANAWSAGSAVLLAEAGFQAIGTTSAGIAYDHALPDYEGKLGFTHSLETTRRIVNAVNAPISMDAENGYAHAPGELADNMKTIAATGVAGASIEDFTGDRLKPLYETSLAVERLQAVKEALSPLDQAFTLTARAECYLTGHDDPFAEAVKRLNLYHEAGADCLFAPGINDIATIRELVREVSGPVNVVVGLGDSSITLEALREAGVRRVSVGGSLARATLGLVRNAAKEMLEHGTFNYMQQQIPDKELCSLFARDIDR